MYEIEYLFTNGHAEQFDGRPVKIYNGKKSAFTLAEVLLTLAVIGIVAAITLPALLVDTTEKAFDAQKRALHARLAQAIGMMSDLSGYGTSDDDAAQTFIYDGLSKVYKMNNICEAGSISKCNLPATITTQAGTDFGAFPTKLSELNSKLIDEVSVDTISGTNSKRSSTRDVKAAAFETINGESVAVFYNPECVNGSEADYISYASDPYLYMQDRMCVNFVYDVNGTKGPNKVGKDIGFITALYSRTPEVAGPLPLDSDYDASAHPWADAVDLCNSSDTRLPNKDELASMFYNMNLVGNFQSGYYWSSSVSTADRAWHQRFNDGGRLSLLRTGGLYVRCVKK